MKCLLFLCSRSKVHLLILAYIKNVDFFLNKNFDIVAIRIKVEYKENLIREVLQNHEQRECVMELMSFF